jgi:heat shock protein HslJ
MNSWNNASNTTKAIIGIIIVAAVILAILALTGVIGGSGESEPAVTATPILEGDPVPTAEPGVPSLTANATAEVWIGPGDDYPQIGILETGDTAEVIGTSADDGWWVIRFPGAPNDQGWVAAESVTTSNASTVPVIQAPPLPTPMPAQPPVAAINAPVQGQVDQAITFDGSGSSGANPIVNYLWEFGDGATVDAVRIDHTYAESGVYNVTLTVVDDQNLQGTATSQIEIIAVLVEPTPEPSQEPTSEPPPETVLTDTDWVVTAYNNGQGAMVSILAGTELMAVFDQDGTLSGTSSCNAYSAAYLVDGSTLTIDTPVAGRQACAEPAGIMEQESAYLAALPLVASYEIAGDQLILTDSAGQIVARYERLKRPLGS